VSEYVLTPTVDQATCHKPFFFAALVVERVDNSSKLHVRQSQLSVFQITFQSWQRNQNPVLVHAASVQ
jgi:hypothetical protein